MLKFVRFYDAHLPSRISQDLQSFRFLLARASTVVPVPHEFAPLVFTSLVVAPLLELSPYRFQNVTRLPSPFA
jgi:hypothetical protein